MFYLTLGKHLHSRPSEHWHCAFEDEKELRPSIFQAYPVVSTPSGAARWTMGIITILDLLWLATRVMAVLVGTS
jgi:hypothetical protein